MNHGSNTNSNHHDELGHFIPTPLLRNVLLTLLVLTAVTVAVSRIDFGVFNIVVAMLIASVKAGLVGLFFMHLKYENKAIWIFVLFPILLLITMIAGIFIDNPFRWVP